MPTAFTATMCAAPRISRSTCVVEHDPRGEVGGLGIPRHPAKSTPSEHGAASITRRDKLSRGRSVAIPEPRQLALTPLEDLLGIGIGDGPGRELRG